MESERFISMNSLCHSVVPKREGGECWMKEEIKTTGKGDLSWATFYEDGKKIGAVQLTTKGATVYKISKETKDIKKIVTIPLKDRLRKDTE